MFDAAFGRILWKEYRSQRALWLSCLGIGAFLQVLIWQVASNSSEGEFSRVFIPGLLSIMYTVGCGALLFAREREERTSDWLLSLAAPAGSMVAAKIGFAVISTILLQWALAFVAVVFNAGRASLTFENMRDMYMPFALLPFVWALLGSLTSRRVLASVGGMVFWVIVTLCLPALIVESILELVFRTSQSSISPHRESVTHYVVYIVLLAALVVFTIRMSLQWSQGRYLDGSILERLSAASAQVLQRLSYVSIKDSRILPKVENEQAWRRTWQRLIWQERHRESMHWILMCLCCVLGPLLAVSSIGQISSLTLLVIPMCLLLPIAMGVFGFEFDADFQQPRFLCNRGVSPGSVWLAKQAIWLPRAFWITAAVFVTALFAEFLAAESKPNDPTGGPFIRRPLQILFAQSSFKYDVAIWYVSLAYGCGQLASVICRRVILAAVFGLLFTIVGIAWMGYVYSLNVPRWWALGLPVVALFGFTLWQMRPLLLEDRSIANRLKIGAAFLLVTVILFSGVGWQRIAEVQAIPKFSTLAYYHPISDDPWRDRLNLATTSTSLNSAEKEVSSQITHLTRSNVRDNKQVADEVVELMQRDVQSLDLNFEYGYVTNFWQLTQNAHQVADEALLNNDLQSPLEAYVACLKLARLFAERKPLAWGWTPASDCQVSTLEHAVRWANHPSQSAESIRAGITRLEQELSKFPLASDAVVASYLEDRKFVEENSIDAFNRYQLAFHLTARNQAELMASWLFPWERSRLRILMSREAEYVYSEVSSLEKELLTLRESLPRPYNVPTPHQSILTEFPHLQRGAPASPSGAKLLLLHRLTAVRAALARMELIAYRREHGRLPNKLIELAETFSGINLIDPWSNRLFDFYPTFLLSTGNSNNTVLPLTGHRAALADSAINWTTTVPMFVAGKDFEHMFDADLKRADTSKNGSHDLSRRTLFIIPKDPLE